MSIRWSLWALAMLIELALAFIIERWAKGLGDD